MALPKTHQDIFAGLEEQYKKGTLGHGYLLLTGDREAAKTFTENIGRLVSPDRYTTDVSIIDPEEGSIGIGPARELRSHLMTAAQQKAYRVGIVLGAERLTPEAQNALLKIAEEPPVFSLLLITLGDPEALAVTLRSRVQTITLPPLTKEEIVAWLTKTRGMEAEKAKTIAEHAYGSLSRALVLSQEVDQELTEEVRALLTASERERGVITKGLAESSTLVAVLRALSYELAYTEWDKRERVLWHRIQVLQRKALRSPLNLRLQLAALFDDLP